MSTNYESENELPESLPPLESGDNDMINEMIMLQNPYTESYTYDPYKMKDLHKLIHNSNLVFLAFDKLASLVVLTLQDACRLRYVSTTIQLAMQGQGMTTTVHRYNNEGAWIISIDMIPSLFSIKLLKPFADIIVHPPIPPAEIKNEVDIQIYIQEQATKKILRNLGYVDKTQSSHAWVVIFELLNILGFTSASNVPTKN